VFPATEPPEEPGCCYGNPDAAYSKRWMDQCKTFGTESECTMLFNGDGVPRCVFEPMGEYEDCETVWPTTTTTTEEVGCCYADSYKANDKCARATDRARCESMDCSFLVTDDSHDCEMTTTTSEPWLGAKHEAMLFGEQGAALREAMDTQVSLSTLMMFAVVALAAQQLYKRWAASHEGDTKLTEAPQRTAHTTFQTA